MAIGIKIGVQFGGITEVNPVAQAPVNTNPPFISPNGNVVIGTLFTTNNGSWYATKPLTFEYRWTRNGTPIGGATSQTYTSVTADEGQTLRCEVKATNAFGASAYIASSNSATGVTLPVNTVAPAISGSTTLGSVLTTTDGTWTGTATITFTYQWKRGGVSIGGATASTYTLVAADSSANITCDVTGTNVAGSSTAGSNTITASNFNPVNTVAPTLSPSGTQNTGTVITLANGTWTGAATITFEYRWLRDNVVISGETNSTYTILAGDDTKVIKGQVRGINSVSTSAYVTTSNQVDAVNVVNTARTQAFLTATGITDQTIIDALNAMDTSLIADGLLPAGTGSGVIKAFYPVVGGTAANHKYNFVDPRDLNIAYRLVFAGGITHNTSGMLFNGTNGSADTCWSPSVDGGGNDLGLCYYAGTYTDNGGISTGAGTATSDFKIYGKLGGSFYWYVNNITNTLVTNADPSGFIGIHREGTDIKRNIRGTTSSATVAQTTLVNRSITIGAANYTGGIAEFTNIPIKSYALFANGATSALMESIRTIMNNLQTDLGRANN
jgi:hypothetical protein